MQCFMKELLEKYSFDIFSIFIDSVVHHIYTHETSTYVSWMELYVYIWFFKWNIQNFLQVK